MNVIIGLLLAIVLVPMAVMAAIVVGYALAVAALGAIPVLLYLAYTASLAHDWSLMSHRLGAGVLCALVGGVTVWRATDIAARAPAPWCQCHGSLKRTPSITDTLAALGSGIPLGVYMRRKYRFER